MEIELRKQSCDLLNFIGRWMMLAIIVLNLLVPGVEYIYTTRVKTDVVPGVVYIRLGFPRLPTRTCCPLTDS